MIRILIDKEINTTRIGQPSSYEKLADTGGRDGGALFGYPEAREIRETKTVKILEQFVSDDLDIPAVIAVINGLEKPLRFKGLETLPPVRAQRQPKGTDEVVDVHEDVYMEVNNAHAFIGVKSIVLREPPHFDVCAHFQIDAVTPELAKRNWIKVSHPAKIFDGVKGMRVESFTTDK